MQGRASHLVEDAGKVSEESQYLRRVKTAELECRSCMSDTRIDWISAELGIEVGIWAGLGRHGGRGKACLSLRLAWM